jgi:2-polyprenyl-3-methyl-5-hydroxy-6-metoxy-1,4-benzoquinol methylase
VRGGLDVLGCDIDDDGLEWMRGQGYEVVHLDAEALEADERFDSVVAGELIEHLENPGLFLAGCRRVLKPDGRLVLSTPNPFAVLHAAIFLKDGRARPFHPEHTGWFCAQTLGQRLERAGFRVERTLYVDDLRPGAGNVGGLYRLFARVWGKVRRFAPERYRNTLVVVATPAA